MASARSALLLLAMLCCGDLVLPAQVPPPRPKPKPRAAPFAPASSGAAAVVRNARIVVVTDVAARLWVDGADAGNLKPDEPRTVSAVAGQHLLLVISHRGGVRRRASVDVAAGTQQLVELTLASDVDAVLATDARATAEARAAAVLEKRAEQLGAAWTSIPEATLTLGCVPADRRCLPDEVRRQVHVPGFQIMTAEATVAAYRAAVARTDAAAVPAQPEWSTRPDHPIVNLTWDEARRFCEAIGGRLPNEAEWELAARGSVRDGIYPWGNAFNGGYANGSGTPAGDSFAAAAPIAMLKPNGFGLHDIIGNVWEWTMGSPDGTDTAVRMARGGGWSSVAAALRVSTRARLRQDARDDTVGVRCVRMP